MMITQHTFEKELFDVNFVMLKDGNPVLTLVKQLKVLPCNRPHSLLIYDNEQCDIDKQAIIAAPYGVECIWKLIILSGGMKVLRVLKY